MKKKEISDRLLSNTKEDITKEIEKEFLTKSILKGLTDQGIDTSQIEIEHIIRDKPITDGKKTILAAKWLLTGRIEGEQGKINLNGLEKIPMDDHKESDFSEEEVTNIVKQLLNQKHHGGFTLKGMTWGPECYIVAEKQQSLSDVYPIKSIDSYPLPHVGAETFNLQIFETIPEAKVCIARRKSDGKELEIYECQLIVRNVAKDVDVI